MRNHNEGITVDRKTCVVCGACTAACPTEALVVEGLALVIVPGRCRPCGQAALVCPTGALKCPDANKKRKRQTGTELK
jgi:NAD-dependent dihydropyrimidine dehydrogenase PreA subunit